MNAMVKIMIVILIGSMFTACATKSFITSDSFRKGVYEAASQAKDLKDPKPLRPPHEENPPYGQYILDRQDMLEGDDDNFLPKLPKKDGKETVTP